MSSPRVLIIGANGNMGTRYRKILSFLGHGYICVDQEQSLSEIKNRAGLASHVLIATPTDTHCDFIRELAPLKIPLLCEKPISKNPGHMIDALREVAKSGTPFSMVYQYGALPDGTGGNTTYNYFRHGNDGLVWDCIQIIGLARSTIELSEESPVWICSLNGRPQSLDQMDTAYIRFIESWIKRPGQDIGYLKELHLKTAELVEEYERKRLH